MKTVLLMDPIAAEGEAFLSKSAQVVRAPDSAPDTIRRLAKDADGIIIRSKLPDDVFDAAARVRAQPQHELVDAARAPQAVGVQHQHELAARGREAAVDRLRVAKVAARAHHPHLRCLALDKLRRSLGPELGRAA